MKRWAPFLILIVLGEATIVISERRNVNTAADPAPLLYLVADTERELSRMPMKFTRMPDDEEVRLGDELARMEVVAVRTETDAESREIQAYVTQVGQRVAAHTHRKLPYRFHYLPAKYLVNAFALPGGHVYIGQGMLSLMDSEDELAAVLGHEIEHIDHYHCAERLQQERALRRIPLGELVAIPVEVFQAGYGKDQELEADRDGTRLIVESGYSANGAVRMFQTFARLYSEEQARPKTPQDELTHVAAGTLQGYFRSHPLPQERIAQVNQMIAGGGWTPRAETDLAISYLFWAERAQDYMAAGRYAEAAELSARAVQKHPGDAKAMRVLAKAQFAQAKFADAAVSYRKLLELNGPAGDLANSYALALAAEDRRTAAGKFRKWMASAKGNVSPLQAQLNGLLLLAGDPTPVRESLTRLNLDDPSAPGELSDLSWWFYSAGDYSTAAGLQQEAVQRRPGDPQMRLRLAWIDIELRRFADALQAINAIAANNQRDDEATMARAVAEWETQQHDDALRQFATTVAHQPEWTNPQWIESLYAPLAVRSAQEMRAELERQKKAKAALNLGAG